MLVDLISTLALTTGLICGFIEPQSLEDRSKRVLLCYLFAKQIKKLSYPRKAYFIVVQGRSVSFPCAKLKIT